MSCVCVCLYAVFDCLMLVGTQLVTCPMRRYPVMHHSELTDVRL
jgi:hypothetical protein